MEENIAEVKRILVLDLSLQDTTARWWTNNKSLVGNWDNVIYRFQNKEQLESEMQTDFQVAQLFNGQSDPKAHIEKCVKQWQVEEIPSLLWVQVFPHSLCTIPKTW